MRVSIAWLETLCDPELAPAAIAEQLTRQGLETTAPAPVAAPPGEIVAVRCAEVTPIPRTNYRHVAADAGARGAFSVVTAAPNVAKGLVGALALPGATLPDGRVIVTHEYVGVRSEAMLCSAAELGLGEASDRLLELPADAAPGAVLADLYGLPDSVLELDVTANRGDCLSVAGIARELHASSGAPLRLPSAEPVGIVHAEDQAVTVEEPAACPRYLGRVVTGLDAGARTPLWLAERLRRAGQRSGHPVVDVMNYVMLELGQPLHAFDREKLAGGIRVRHARAGERLTLLEDTNAKLDEEMLVIADDNGPLALAGIMGGAASAVSAGTQSVFIESAHFAPRAVRGRTRRLGIASEAAHRYERGVDPRLPRVALERATALLSGIAGGSPGPVVTVESLEDLPARAPILFDPRSVTRLLGFAMDTREIERILAGLGFAHETRGDTLEVTPPSARFDIEREADLVEEVARIAGYERIPAVAPRRRMAAPRLAGRGHSGRALAHRLGSHLVARGYDEAITLSLVSPQTDAAFAPASSPAKAQEPRSRAAAADPAGAALRLRNPLSEHESALRRSLWPGLLAALAHNVAHQAERVRLFEIGTVFGADGAERRRLGAALWGARAPEQWGSPRRTADFHDLKGDLEVLLAAAGIARPEFALTERAGLAPGRAARAVANGVMLAEFGVIAPELATRHDFPAQTLLLELDLAALAPPSAAQAHAIPRYPAVRRDFALLVPAGVAAETLRALARRHGGGRLVETRIFDVYTGKGIPEGARSIGLGLIFRDACRTLTDAEVDAAVSAIITGLAEEANVHVRS